MAHEEYLSEQEVACISVLVEKNSTAVLGDHVQVLRLGDVGDSLHLLARR